MEDENRRHDFGSAEVGDGNDNEVPEDLAPEAAIPMVPLAAAGDTDHITLGSNDPPLGPISNDGSTVEDVVTEGLVSDTLSPSSPGLEHAIEALAQTVSRLDCTMSTQAKLPPWFGFAQTLMAMFSLLIAIIMARPQWFDHLLNGWMARLALKSYCANYTQTVNETQSVALCAETNLTDVAPLPTLAKRWGLLPALPIDIAAAFHIGFTRFLTIVWLVLQAFIISRTAHYRTQSSLLISLMMILATPVALASSLFSVQPNIIPFLNFSILSVVTLYVFCLHWGLVLCFYGPSILGFVWRNAPATNVNV